MSYNRNQNISNNNRIFKDIDKQLRYEQKISILKVSLIFMTLAVILGFVLKLTIDVPEFVRFFFGL